ncbi:hypothetical protein HDU76_008296, partial [Blyttiomyces sp. JEL0837]
DCGNVNDTSSLETVLNVCGSIAGIVNPSTPPVYTTLPTVRPASTDPNANWYSGGGIGIRGNGIGFSAKMGIIVGSVVWFVFWLSE